MGKQIGFYFYLYSILLQYSITQQRQHYMVTIGSISTIFDVIRIGLTILATMLTIKVTKLKLGSFKHAISMSKRPAGSVYIDSILYYVIYLPDNFPSGL